LVQTQLSYVDIGTHFGVPSSSNDGVAGLPVEFSAWPR
jgi:hypothetical protein